MFRVLGIYNFDVLLNCPSKESNNNPELKSKWKLKVGQSFYRVQISIIFKGAWSKYMYIYVCTLCIAQITVVTVSLPCVTNFHRKYFQCIIDLLLFYIHCWKKKGEVRNICRILSGSGFCSYCLRAKIKILVGSYNQFIFPLFYPHIIM